MSQTQIIQKFSLCVRPHRSSTYIGIDCKQPQTETLPPVRADDTKEQLIVHVIDTCRNQLLCLKLVGAAKLLKIPCMCF